MRGVRTPRTSAAWCDYREGYPDVVFAPIRHGPAQRLVETTPAAIAALEQMWDWGVESIAATPWPAPL